MPGPGEYRPDPSEGITRIEDLPKPKIRCQSRNYRRRPCPRCGQSAYRDRRVRRTLHDLGNPLTGRPRDLILICSQHYCTRCRKYFNADMTDLAAPGSHYTKRVVDTAVRLVIEDGLPYRAASWSLWRDHRVFVPYATIQNWVEDGGEKAQRRIPTDYLDWALSDFSGCQGAAPSCQGSGPRGGPHWLEVTYPAIEARAAREDAEIHWCDETGAAADQQPRRGYAREGRPARIEVPDPHIRMNLISTISNEGSVHFMTYKETMTAALFITFLERMLSETTRKIFLIVDRLRAHEAKKVEAWAAEHRDRIELFFLPRYAPERMRTST